MNNLAVKIPSVNNLTAEEIGRYYTEDSNRRIVTLDFLRGVAIWLMIFFHASTHLYDYTWFADNPENLYTLPVPLIVLLLLLIALGSWATFFILISAIVNSFSMSRRAIQGKNVRVAFHKQIFSGLGILFIGWITESFIGMQGYFGYAIRSGDWTNFYPIWNALFAMKALQIIGWSLIINSSIHFFLMRNGGYLFFARNLAVYAIIFLGIVVLTPFAHNWVDHLEWVIPEAIPVDTIDYFNPLWPDQYVQTHNASLRTFFLVWLMGDQLPLFPCLGASIIGSIIGMTLAKENPSKKILFWGAIIGSIMTIIGITLTILGYPFFPYGRPPIAGFLLQIGVQILVIMLLFRLVEFRGKAAKFAKNPIIKYFRLWSMVSLSIFCLQIYEMLAKWILTLIVSPFRSLNFLHHGIFSYYSFLWPMLAALFVIFCFDIFLRLWSKINFIASFEWFVIRFQSIATKEISPRLDVDLMMNRMNWINFEGEIIQDEMS